MMVERRDAKGVHHIFLLGRNGTRTYPCSGLPFPMDLMLKHFAFSLLNG
jgi:hypothetical protein